MNRNLEANVNTNREQRTAKGERRPLLDVALLFLRLGVTAFGGPAAHVALIQRECVERRQWITRQEFLDLLAVSSLIPGPTSTELAMHVGRIHAGWIGLIVAGVCFIAPASAIVAALAFVYVQTGDLPATRGLLAAVQPVVVIMVLQILPPLGRSAIRTPSLAAIAAASAVAALAGVPEIYVLLAAGLVAIARTQMIAGVAAVAMASGVLLAAEAPTRAASTDVAVYFLRVGSLLFGSGYVLLPVLHGDLVDRLGWLTEQQLLDAIAAGQATPGPLFTTATFIGYLLGGPAVAAVATVAMFAPAFVFSAISSAVMDRLRASPRVRAFLDGVNAAAVALIAVVVVMLGRAAFEGWWPIAVGFASAIAIFVAQVSPTRVLLAAACIGVVRGLWMG